MSGGDSAPPTAAPVLKMPMPSARAHGEPLADNLGRARPVPGLAEAQRRAEDTEGRRRSGGRMGQRRRGPDDNREDESEACADDVVEAARDQLADAVEQQEAVLD